MSNFLEIEFKNILTKSEYQQLMIYFNKDDENLKKQVNHYFDTKELKLRKLNCALRARVYSNYIELTLKQPQEVGLLETTDIITLDDLNTIKSTKNLVRGNVFDALNSIIEDSEIITVAELTTYRFETDYLDNTLVLDKSIYYNQIDYEIELETKSYDYGKNVFNKLLHQFKIPQRITKNKIARAYEYKEQNSQ